MTIYSTILYILKCQKIPAVQNLRLDNRFGPINHYTGAFSNIDPHPSAIMMMTTLCSGPRIITIAAHSRIYEGNTILIDDIITGLFTCQLNANIFITRGKCPWVWHCNYRSSLTNTRYLLHGLSTLQDDEKYK